MALNNNDQTRIREYLLGKLNDADQEKLEERLMVEDDLFQEFEISKSELIEEYRAAELSPAENSWFETHFLSCTEGKEKLALAQALDHLQAAKTEPPVRLSLLDRLKNFLKVQPMVLATTAGALAILIIAIVVLVPRGETVNGPTLAMSFINRESGPLPEQVVVPANASAMKFRLRLPANLTPAPRYRAQLDNRTDVTKLSVSEQEQDTVSVVVPVKLIPPGQYALRLIAIAADGTEREIPGDYLFIVPEVRRK